MNMIYIVKPLFILFPILLIALQLIFFFIEKKINITWLTKIILTGIGVIGHTVSITIILMCGGTLHDAMLLVLLSGATSLFLSPKENQIKTDKEEIN